MKNEPFRVVHCLGKVEAFLVTYTDLHNAYKRNVSTNVANVFLWIVRQNIRST